MIDTAEKKTEICPQLIVVHPRMPLLGLGCGLGDRGGCNTPLYGRAFKINVKPMYFIYPHLILICPYICKRL